MKYIQKSIFDHPIAISHFNSKKTKKNLSNRKLLKLTKFLFTWCDYDCCTCFTSLLQFKINLQILVFILVWWRRHDIEVDDTTRPTSFWLYRNFTIHNYSITLWLLLCTLIERNWTELNWIVNGMGWLTL